MNETKWTAMPWVIDESQGEVVIAGGETESGNMAVIAVMGQYWDSEENDANASLIAQSPALYEALEAALRFTDPEHLQAYTGHYLRWRKDGAAAAADACNDFALELSTLNALMRAVLAAARGTAE